MQKLADGARPPSETGVETARQLMRASQATPLEHESIAIERVEAAGLTLTIVRPRQAEEQLPAVLYMHGGGWVLGGIETHARVVRELALRADVAIVFPHFSLAPEARFPVALEQCYRALRWIEAHGAEHRIDAGSIAVAGDSAGGNLAAAVALLAVQRGGPRLQLQALVCPVTQPSFHTGSYDEFATGLNLTRESMEWFWNQYVPDAARRLEPAISPLWAPLTDLADIAPAAIVTAECDVLRDDGELYARRLLEAGVTVSAIRCLGTIHNFPVVDDLQRTQPAITALRFVGAALKEALHK